MRLSRWVLAPVSTARLRRRMILQEIVSYPEALAWDRQRRLAKSDLQDRYGRLAWRWQAPRRQRLDYRLGELHPADARPPRLRRCRPPEAHPLRPTRRRRPPAATASTTTAPPAT